MISIEMHRAAIGRFSRGVKYFSFAGASKKKEWIQDAFFLFIFTFLQLALYKLVFTIMYVFFNYILSFLMVGLMYGYSYWILKHISKLLSITVKLMATNTVLVNAPSLLNGIEVPSLQMRSQMQMQISSYFCTRWWRLGRLAKQTWLQKINNSSPYWCSTHIVWSL